MYIQPSASVRAGAQVYLSRRLDRYNSPCLFILPCSIQDRAIKEHSGCQLDEFFFAASLWQVRICSLAEKIGLNRIPLFPWMSVLIRVLCCPHKALKTQLCRQSAVQRFFLNIMLHICRLTTHNSSTVDRSTYSFLTIRRLIRQLIALPCMYRTQKHVFPGRNGSSTSVWALTWSARTECHAGRSYKIQMVTLAKRWPFNCSFDVFCCSFDVQPCQSQLSGVAQSRKGPLPACHTKRLASESSVCQPTASAFLRCLLLSSITFPSFF